MRWSGIAVFFEIIGATGDIETSSVGSRIRDSRRLRRQFGRGRWQKLKETAMVGLEQGPLRGAESHWHEAHGLGPCHMKLERLLDR